MAYTLSNMIRDGITTLGRVAYRRFTATGGSTTTALNTNFNLVGDPVYTDGDESLVLGTLFVVSTTDGAAPQGEFQRISAYTETTTTIEVDTAFSAAIGAGDSLMIIHSQFKIEDLVELANQTLVDLGQFYFVDSSLTTTTTRDYTLPIAAKGARPYSVEIETDTDQREYVNDYNYITATPGTEATLQFNSSLVSGKTLYITYQAEHPRLVDWDDVLDESIPESVAKWGLSSSILRWQNPSDGVELQAMNEALRNYEVAKQRMTRWAPKRVPKWANY